MYTFADLQTEVKKRALLNESGSTFDVAVRNAINTSLFRLSREFNFRVLRRKTTFETEAEYSTGTGAVSVTNGSKNVTVTGATFITDGIQIGRRIDLGGSSKTYIIKTITGETTITVDKTYDGTTSTTQSYKIYGREEYNLPLQAGRISMLWHEDYGYPFTMRFITDLDFFSSGVTIENGDTPAWWKQWEINTVIQQPIDNSVMRVSSSDSADTSKNITIFGTVGGYPDFETIVTNGSDGTTAVSGTKTFDVGSIERVVKDSSTAGRITVDSNSANVTVAVIPAGDITAGIEYKKVQVFPLPTRVFPINVFYYKDPWRLVNDQDVHELGHQSDEAVILLASSKMLYAQGKKSDGDKFFALYLDEVSSLKKANADTIANWLPMMRKPHQGRGIRGPLVNRHLSFAQVGGFFGPVWR